MYQAKHYITFLEGRTQDGRQWSCELQLTPIGFSAMLPASYWTRVFASLTEYKGHDLTTLTLEELAFLQKHHLNEQED